MVGLLAGGGGAEGSEVPEARQHASVKTAPPTTLGSSGTYGATVNRIERLFRQLEEDYRLRILPLAAQMVWLRLARLAASTPGFDGVMQFGSDRGFLALVALAVTCTETELEPNLACLERCGLVRRGEDGTSLILPQLERSSARAEAARINGLKGGARRKGETLDQRRERRQRELMMPIAGSLSGTQAEPCEETSRAGTGTTESIDSKKVGGTGREKPAWVSLGEEIAALCGFEPRAGWKGFDPVRGWLEAGATPNQILDLVRERMARRPPPYVSNLHYFTDAVMEAIGDGGSQAKAARPASKGEAWSGHDAYAEEVIRPWQANGCQGIPIARAAWMAARQAAA